MPVPVAFLRKSRLFIAVLIGCHRSFQFVLEYLATFHDELYSLKLGNVGDGIAGDRDQIRELPPFHGANPILRWMASNVVVQTDPTGAIKPDKDKSAEKIDGIVALVMGLARANEYRDVATPEFFTL